MTRLRRLRQSKAIRDLVRETSLDTGDLVCPLFVDETVRERIAIRSMPGVERLPLAALEEEVDAIEDLGIRAVLLFGIPARKDAQGTGAFAPGNVIEQALKLIGKKRRDLLIMTDVCLCEYTSHGHCGPIDEAKCTVNNDETLDIIAKAAVNYARAGANVVAPSGMMDGMVHALRSELDFHGLKDTLIMSYAAKYASAFYGPFREAASSKYTGFDRSTYQMDPGNADEALREVALDIEEGADIVLVKPALAYLDIVHRVKATFQVPVAAYNVSGEYAMVKAAAANGWLDERAAMRETLLAIRRAGADMIVTYFAKDFAALVKEGEKR